MLGTISPVGLYGAPVAEHNGLRSRWRRSVLMAMVALLVLTGLAVSGSRVDAAGPSITACFKFRNNTAYASAPVQLYHQVAGVWKDSGRAGRTNASGCATFQNLVSNRRHQIKAFYSYPANHWTQWIGSLPVYHYDVYYYVGWSTAPYVTSSVSLGWFWVDGPGYWY